MNDYWNDPPDDTFEPPECCGEMMALREDGTCQCAICEKVYQPGPEEDWELPAPKEPIGWDDRLVNFPPKCPHGNEWFACDACDHASDIAYDTERERRLK